MKTTSRRQILTTLIWLIFVSDLFGHSITDQVEYISRSDTTNPSYRLLTDSTSTLLYGEYCGLDGQDQPAGRLAIEDLIAKKQFSLIKELLDSQNNEGRVYAIEALLDLNRNGIINLSSFDKKKIIRIIEKDFEIFRCLGCEYETIDSSDLFQEQKFQDLLNSNEIKITIANTK